MSKSLRKGAEVWHKLFPLKLGQRVKVVKRIRPARSTRPIITQECFNLNLIGIRGTIVAVNDTESRSYRFPYLVELDKFFTIKKDHPRIRKRNRIWFARKEIEPCRKWTRKK